MGEDFDRLMNLIEARHPGIRVVTTEERVVVGLAARAADALERPLRRWSVTTGVSDPRRPDASIENSEHAAASEGFRDAEIEQAVVAALHTAFARGDRMSTEDLRAAVAETTPLAVTRAEQIAALRRWGRERCVPAN